MEIGAGMGYNAALLPRLVEQARRNLFAADVGGVTVICADGAGGWPGSRDGPLTVRLLIEADGESRSSAFRNQSGDLQPMTESASSPLEPLREDWQRALAIVAHPDDLEYGAAAAVARWTRQGKDVRYCMVTSGEAGIDTMAPDRARPIREAEQRASARIVGVPTVEFLGHPDGVVEYSIALRCDLARSVRRHQPEIVITTNFRETYGPGALNQADHIAVGRATVDAVRDAGNRWVFPELLDEGLEPWAGVWEVWAGGSPLAAHAIDTTDTFDLGVASLKAHAAYLSALEGQMSEPEEFLSAVGRATGTRLRTRYAAAFEVIPISGASAD